MQKKTVLLIINPVAGFHKIICCGGDGTLNEVFTGLTMAKLDIPVGYIPTGTTNDLAHALDLPHKIKSAMKITLNENA